MISNADQNDGYWEAARIPVNNKDFELVTINDVKYVNYKPTNVDDTTATDFADVDLSNHNTYQTGKIRDLHRLQFKLNSVATEHMYKTIDSTVTIDMLMDNQFDMIIIKLSGRKSATEPTVIMYDVVSNQEVIYEQNTALSRLMTDSPLSTRIEEIIYRSNMPTPASRNTNYTKGSE
jgi:hypothetical protein